MQFAGTSIVAVLAAAIAAFAFGAGWYGMLSRPWMKAQRRDPATAQVNPAVFAITFVCELVMAFVLAAFIRNFGSGEMTVVNGVAAATVAWVGFIATTLIVNQRYEGFGWDLTLIDGGHWLGVALVMGALLGWLA